MEPTKPNFNPDQNPFEQMIAQSAAGQQPSMQNMPQQGMSPQGQMPQQESPTGDMGEQPEALQMGKTGDNTRPLLGAITQLHQFIASSTSPEEINIVRQIVSLLTRLVSRDQEKSGQMMQQQMGSSVQ